MTDSVNDRVREQVSAFGGGTGVVTLPVVAVSGFQTFLAGWAASGTGDYCLVMGAQWETGLGTLNAGGTTLTRTTVYNGSSGSGVAVTFSAGVLDCFGDMPAELMHYLNMREITVASATTTDIGAAQGSNVVVSGTVTITSFGTKKNRRRFVRFSGALILTHNASSLILPGASNITTVAGDTAIFHSDSSGNWRCVDYIPSASAPFGTAGTALHKGPLDLSASAAGQISFPSAQNSSAGANTLDDYEEGTFTPGFSFGGGTTGITYGNQIGRYQKVGNRVHVQGFLNLSNKGSSTGSAVVTGLPFTSINATLAHASLATWATVMSAATTAVSSLFNTNATTFSVWHMVSGSATQLSNAEFTNTSQVAFGGSYEASS